MKAYDSKTVRFCDRVNATKLTLPVFRQTCYSFYKRMKGFLMGYGIATVLRSLLYTGLWLYFKIQHTFRFVMTVHKPCYAMFR